MSWRHLIRGFGLVLVAVSLSWAQPARRLELSNGEVLLGQLLSEDDVFYLFRSESLGELKVPRAGSRLTVLPPATAEAAAQPPPWQRGSGAPAAGTAPAEPEDVAGAKWRRLIEAGYSYQSRGSLVSSTSTYVRAEISRESATGRLALEGRYIFGKQDDQRNTDKLDAAFKIRQKLYRRIDLRNDFTYGFDYLKELSHQFEDVAGFTCTLLDDQHIRYAAGPGLAVQYAEPMMGETGFKLLGDITHELSIKFHDRVSLTHSASYLFVPANLGDYRLRAVSTLSGQITEKVTVSLRYEYEFEAIRPLVSGRSDHRVFTTLGYLF